MRAGGPTGFALWLLWEGGLWDLIGCFVPSARTRGNWVWLFFPCRPDYDLRGWLDIKQQLSILFFPSLRDLFDLFLFSLCFPCVRKRLNGFGRFCLLREWWISFFFLWETEGYYWICLYFLLERMKATGWVCFFCPLKEWGSLDIVFCFLLTETGLLDMFPSVRENEG